MLTRASKRLTRASKREKCLVQKLTRASSVKISAPEAGRERQKREKCLVQMLTKYLVSDASVKAALLVVCTKSSKASLCAGGLSMHYSNAAAAALE